jgi:hypothetical protein
MITVCANRAASALAPLEVFELCFAAALSERSRCI